MVIVPSQGLKEALIRGGITKMKILKDNIEYRDQAIGIMSIQRKRSQNSGYRRGDAFLIGNPIFQEDSS